MRGYVAEKWFSIQMFMLLCRISDPNVLPLSLLSTHSDQRSKRQTHSLCYPASFSFELGLSKTVGNRHPLIQIPLVVHSPFIICCVLQTLPQSISLFPFFCLFLITCPLLACSSQLTLLSLVIDSHDSCHPWEMGLTIFAQLLSKSMCQLSWHLFVPCDLFLEESHSCVFWHL